MNEPKVIIILLNYNQLNNITECIESFSNINYTNYSFLIIDNCSTDGSWDLIQKIFPSIPKYKTSHNSGYTGGINFGFRKALEMNPDYVMILNPDTIVTNNFLSTLVNALEENPSAAAAGALILTEHNRDEIWYAGGKLVPWRGLAVHFNKGKNVCNYKQSTPVFVNFLTGCMQLFRAGTLMDTGMENEKFFLYLEDIEYSARMIKKGFRLLYVPDSIIYHKVFGEDDDILKAYYSIRNRLLLINSMNSGVIRIISNAYFLSVISCKLIYWGLFNKQFFKAASKGLKDYFSGNLYEGRGLIYFYN